ELSYPLHEKITPLINKVEKVYHKTGEKEAVGRVRFCEFGLNQSFAQRMAISQTVWLVSTRKMMQGRNGMMIDATMLLGIKEWGRTPTGRTPYMVSLRGLRQV
ncbi:MAG: hypothetical protein RSC68_34585, partial [Acinetobacter sp.]